MTSRVVCGAGVPHVPVFPQQAAAGNTDVAARYATVREALERADPTLLIVVANDHLNTFFLDRLPTFAIGLGDSLPGPVDEVNGVGDAGIRVDPDAAAALASDLVTSGFDLALCHDIAADHSVVVPLHFLNHRDLPVVAVYVNGFVSPLPTAHRCHELGRAIGDAVRSVPGDHRIAVIASGSFSQEVGGPRVDPGRTWSVPRPDWAARVADALASNDVSAILDAATPVTLASAGSVAGEVLSWFVMLGAVRHESALHPSIDYRPGEAFAFGLWSER